MTPTLTEAYAIEDRHLSGAIVKRPIVLVRGGLHSVG
jgi:hypothetical protein